MASRQSTLPPNPPTWNKAVTDLFNGSSMDNPPSSVITSRPGTGYQDEINFRLPCSTQPTGRMPRMSLPTWPRHREPRRASAAGLVYANKTPLALDRLAPLNDAPSRGDRSYCGRRRGTFLLGSELPKLISVLTLHEPFFSLPKLRISAVTVLRADASIPKYGPRPPDWPRCDQMLMLSLWCRTTPVSGR